MARYSTIKETADFFHVSAWKIRDLCRRGKMPYLRIGTSYRIDLDAAEEAMKRPGEPEPVKQSGNFNFIEALKAI